MNDVQSQDQIWAEIISEELAAPRRPEPQYHAPAYHRNGYYALKQSQPELYSRYRNHVRLCFDKYDYGWKVPEGPPVHLNNKHTLNHYLDSRKAEDRRLKKCWEKLKSLSLSKVESHNKGHATYYYTSNPSSHYALLMLDVDDKDGSVGIATVREVHNYLLTLFPDHFNQVSTGGRGWHGYIVVDYPDISIATFRRLVRVLEDRIQDRIRCRFPSLHAISDKPFEIKGLPALRNQYGAYVTCGSLAKIPRLPDDEAIAVYMDAVSVTYPPRYLQSVIDDLTILTPSIPLEDIDMDTGVSGLKTHVSISMSSTGKQAVPKLPDGWHPDPCTRMNNCAWNLTLRLKRAATESEVWDEYHLLGWNTAEDDDGNRRKLCREAAEWCAAHYDPKKQESFDLANTVQLVQVHVTDEIRNIVRDRSRYQYTAEHLAVCLHTIERASVIRHHNPELQFTVPNNSIIAMMTKLGIELEGTPEVQRKRLSAIKMALIEAGLATVVDASWCTGKGKCYALGPNHPRYQEYLRLQQAHDHLMKLPDDVIVLTGKRRMKCR